MKLKASDLIGLSKNKHVIITVNGYEIGEVYQDQDDLVFQSVNDTWSCNKDLPIELDSRGRSTVDLAYDYPYTDRDAEAHLEVEIFIPMTEANFTKLQLGVFHVD